MHIPNVCATTMLQQPCVYLSGTSLLKSTLPVVQDASPVLHAARPLIAMNHHGHQIELANLQPAPTAALPANLPWPPHLAASLFPCQALLPGDAPIWRRAHLLLTQCPAIKLVLRHDSIENQDLCSKLFQHYTLEENKPASYEHWFRFKNTQQRQRHNLKYNK